VPGVHPIELGGVVAYRRPQGDAEGPAGIGIEIADVAPQLGATIDHLVSGFRGIQILLLSGDRQDRTTLARSIKSIVTTAEVVQAADSEVAKTLLAPEIDLVVIDLDFHSDGGFETLGLARAIEPRMPIVAITSNATLREQARAQGADETASNPTPFTDLQVVLVRALSKPISIKVLAARTPTPIPMSPA
jgi:CheY-like chemotaxis protein